MEGGSPPSVSGTDPAALQDLLDRRTACLEELKRISRRDEQLVMERMHNLSVSVHSSSTHSHSNTSTFGASDTSSAVPPSPVPAPSPEVPATVLTMAVPLRTSAPPTQGRQGVAPARKLTFSLPQPRSLDCSDHVADAARKPLRSSPKAVLPAPRAAGPFVSKRDRDGSVSVYSPSDAPPEPLWLSSSGAKAPPASPVSIRAPPTRRPPRGELAVAASPIERPSATTPDARDSAGTQQSAGPSSFSFTPLVGQRALFGSDTPTPATGGVDVAAITPMTMGPPAMRRVRSFDDELNAAAIGSMVKDNAGLVNASILGRSPADPAVLDTLSVLGAELRSAQGTSGDANGVSRQLLPPVGGGSPPQLVCGRPVPVPFASCGPSARPSLLLQDYDDDFCNRENLGPSATATARGRSRPQLRQ